MKYTLNVNQKKAIADLLINLTTALISITVVSQIIILKDLSLYSIFIGSFSVIISLVMFRLSILILKK